MDDGLFVLVKEWRLVADFDQRLPSEKHVTVLQRAVGIVFVAINKDLIPGKLDLNHSKKISGDFLETNDIESINAKIEPVEDGLFARALLLRVATGHFVLVQRLTVRGLDHVHLCVFLVEHIPCGDADELAVDVDECGDKLVVGKTVQREDVADGRFLNLLGRDAAVFCATELTAGERN